MEEKKLQTSGEQTYGIPSPDVLKPIFVYESHPGGTHAYGDAKVAKEDPVRTASDFDLYDWKLRSE